MTGTSGSAENLSDTFVYDALLASTLYDAPSSSIMHGASEVELHIVPLSQIRSVQQDDCEPAKGR